MIPPLTYTPTKLFCDQKIHDSVQYGHKLLAYHLTWVGGGEEEERETERLVLSILLLASISTAQCKLWDLRVCVCVCVCVCDEVQTFWKFVLCKNRYLD
jgi:hypothetical protein